MSTVCSSKVISNKFRVRQFEYHPQISNLLLFGTVRGNMCLYDFHSEELSYLGSYGLNSLDAILGICWLKNNQNKFVIGSSYGKLICSDIRNKVKGHSIETNEPYFEYNEFNKLTSVHVNSSSERLLVSGYSNDVLLYDIEHAAPVQTFSGIHSNHINIARFANLSPNLFVTCSFDKTVKSWDQRMTTRQPIYSIQGENGFVMVNFSPDDTFLLTSANDNEINQYLSVDGSQHTSFQVPRTGLKGNFSRAYYSSSGSRIITGACEESGLSILDASTGELLSRVDVYSGRKNDSLYIQSLRAAPTVEDEFCALANYKSVRNREIVHIKMKGHSSNKMRTRMAASFDASLATVPLVELGLHNDDLAVMDTKPVEFKDPVSESDNLLMALGRQYHTPALANSLAQLQSLASACTEYVHLQATPVDLDKMNLNEEIIVSDAPIAPSFIAHLDYVHNPRHIDVILLVKTDTEDVDGCGFKLFPVHSFILRSRCYFLAQRLKTQSITTGVSETNSNKSLNVINIIDLVPPSCVHLFPLLVRFLYEDSAVDAEVDHSNLQASGPSFSGICLNMVRQFCLKRLLNQPSSSFLQYGNQLGDGQVNDWLEMSADEVLWRSDGIATELVNTLEMILLIARNFELTNLQQLIINFLARSTHIHNVFDVLRISKRFCRDDLLQHVLAFTAAHINILQALESQRVNVSGSENRLDVVKDDIYRIIDKSRVFIRPESQAADEAAFRSKPSCTVGRWDNDELAGSLGYVSEDEEYDYLRCTEMSDVTDQFKTDSTIISEETENNGICSDFKYTYLPKMVHHSVTRVFDTQVLVMGGRDRYSSTPLTNLLFFDTQTLTWSHVKATGKAPTQLINHHAAPLTANPFSRFVAVVGGTVEDEFTGIESESISLLDCATMTWHRPVIHARSVPEGETGPPRDWLTRRSRFSMAAYYCPPQFEHNKESYKSSNFDESWVSSRTQADTSRILQGNLSSNCSLSIQSSSTVPTEAVGRQETRLLIFGGVERNSVKADLHVIICTKELRCVSSSSGSPSIAAETIFDWKFESFTPRIGGTRPSFRCDYPSVIIHCSEESGGDRMLVCGGTGVNGSIWPILSLRCSDLQNMAWETVTERGPGPTLRRFNSFTAVKGPAGGVASEIVVLIGGLDEESESSLSDVWVLSIVEASFQTGLTVQWEKISTSGPLPLISASPKSFLCHRVLEVNGCLFSFGGMHGIGDNHFSYVSILSTPMNHIHVASVDTESVIDSHSISSLGAPRLAAAEVLIRNLSYYGGSNADKWIWLAHQPEDESLLLYPTTTEGSFRLLYHNKLPSTIMEGVPQTHLNLASVQSILIVPVDICLGNYRSSLQSDLLRLFDRAQCEGQSPGDYDIQFLVESFTETDSMHEPLDGNLSANNSIDEGQSSLNVETSSPLTFTPMVVRAHKELLKRRCTYWRAVFDSSMSESRELEVRVRVEQPSAFYAFIRYLYTDILYMESGDYVSLCELAKKYDMPDLAARCEILACRHVSASDETACELLQYAEYLQLRTLWKASASHLLRSRFRGQQSGAGVASSYSESTQVTPVNDDTQLDVNITENKHDNVSSVTEPPADETPQQQQIQLSEDSAINEILKKFLETVPSNVYSLDIDILSRRK